ncbi:GNAT family N-acetyltransferase [Paucilactobacillus wasatchensis]|uniref:Acetyltransferase n=1 Tax=Paucilactobacillus wasatchensis TaxID=1335616 RepID=A0A0D0YX51_9LACO|nr:GNAT family N-acetyltransferase [Paucilactobacillus wasatchensis]KIS03819.1 Acetyltransferase [Paucilactobacillus wasatchensis]
MKVEKLTQIDEQQLDNIMAIWLDSNVEVHHFIAASYWQDAYDEVKLQIKNADIFVAYHVDKIVGFAGLTANYIAGIFVVSEYRNQGIGGCIINELKRRYSDLELDVYQKNESALVFYQHNGFKTVRQSIEAATDELELQMKWQKN